jgi:outer membrane protein, multidrug efflux system
MQRVIILFLLLTASGCKLKMTDQQDSPAVPSTYSEEIQSESRGLGFKEFFAYDTLLTGYVKQALAHNLSLQMAEARMRQVAFAALGHKFWYLPQIGMAAGTGVRRFGKYTIDGVGNFDTNFSPNLTDEQKIPENVPDYFLGFSAAWEIDIWGKNIARRKSARLKYEAEQFRYKAAQNMLSAQVAANYILLQSLDEMSRILAKNRELQSRALEVINAQNDAGRANSFGVSQVEARLYSTKALEKSVEMELKIAELQFCELLGTYPQRIERSEWPETIMLPEKIGLGSPADLLAERPDILLAEKQVLAAKADVYAAKADFLPSLTIQGNIGLNGFNARQFFDPVSLAFQFLGGLSAPLFQGAQIRAKYGIANQQQAEAVLGYKDVVLKSFTEILSLWNKYQLLQSIRELKEAEVNSLYEAVNAGDQLFIFSSLSYLEIITAQKAVLEGEIELLSIEREQLYSVVNLYRALGAP